MFFRNANTVASLLHLRFVKTIVFLLASVLQHESRLMPSVSYSELTLSKMTQFYYREIFTAHIVIIIITSAV